MSWDAHVVMAVPGPAEEGCGGSYHCLPPLVPGVSSQPLPPRSGQAKLCREGALVAGSLQGAGRAGTGPGPHSACCPKLGAGDRREPSSECWETGLGGQSSCPIPGSRVKEDAIRKQTPSLGCLVISAPSLSAVLSACPGCCLTPWTTAGSRSRHWLFSFAGQGFVHMPTACLVVMPWGRMWPRNGTHQEYLCSRGPSHGQEGTMGGWRC